MSGEGRGTVGENRAGSLACSEAEDAVSTREMDLLKRMEWLRLAAQGSELGLWSEGIGIQRMRERTNILGGDLRIETRPTVEGTRIAVMIPLDHDC